MLTIRKEQMDVFSTRMRHTLVAPLVVHMDEHFPNRCFNMDDSQIQQTVELGLERASQYGLLTEREVFLYVSLMFLLGSGFDRDIQLPWAAEILAKDEFPDPYQKIQALYDVAMSYLDRVIGEDEEEQLQVVSRLENFDLESATQRSKRNLPIESINSFTEIHPRKAAEIGDAGLRTLLSIGTESASKYGITQNQGLLVYGLHLFLLGTEFDTDPQFLWAQEILNDTLVPTENEKIARLYKTIVAHLKSIC